jgi:hypothetical protein
MHLLVKSQGIIVSKLAEYQNGILTTGGLYKEEDLESLSGEVIGVTYNAAACTELPIDWHDRLFLDDNNNRQHILDILFETDRPYLMEDGYRSQEVVG